jgi:hypothetical protein
LLDQEGSRHALVLHDGVLLIPGALKEMLNVALQSDRPVVAPFSNDGSPEQRMVIDRGLSLEGLDKVMGSRVADRGDRRRRISTCGGFCMLIDLGRVRRSHEDPSRLGLGGLNGRLRPGRILQATRSYAHVLSHPPGAPDPELGAWPGGPFDLALGDEGEAAARAGIVTDLARFVGRIKPLLAALKENPGDARVLARIGLLYLGQGDIHNAMSFLGRAKKIDPFNVDVRGAHLQARSALDAAACAP